MKSLRIGLVGAGAIAMDHANSLKRLRTVKSLAVFDPDVSRAKALGAAHGATPCASLRELSEASDVFWICTPPFARAEAIAEACRSGLPIFCEKPLAVDSRGLASVMRCVARAKVPSFMGQSGRFAAFGLKMKELVDAGAIGTPRIAWSTRLGWLDPAKTPAWRMDDQLGGGILIELGIHEIDFLRWVAGDVVDVAACAASKDGFQHSVSALGSFASGAAFRLDMSWASPRYLWQRGVEGDEGSLLFDDMRVCEVALLRAGKNPRIFRVENWLDARTGENTALRNQARDVVARVVSGQAPLVTLEQGADAVRVALAMRKAAASGRTVQVGSGGEGGKGKRA